MLAPRDVDAGGTWIGVRADGTWSCLLNGYLEDGTETALENPQTRGRLIPLILGQDDPISALVNEDLTNTRSFRLWIGDVRSILDCFWDGQKLYKDRLSASAWHFTTSSSLDQREVQRQRGAAFAHWVAEGSPHLPNGIPSLLSEPRGLPASHAMHMEREVSHTKSCTQIDVLPTSIRMQHWLAEAMTDEPSTIVQLARAS